MQLKKDYKIYLLDDDVFYMNIFQPSTLLTSGY